MENLFFENEDVILSVADYEVDCITGETPTIDVMVDCFLRNAYNFDKEGHPWYQCSKDREDVEYWREIEDKIVNMPYSDLQAQRSEFYASFR